MLSLLSKYVLPVVALGLLIFAIVYVFPARSEPAPAPPLAAPPTAPFMPAVAAAGVVEAETENIAIGTPIAGIVVEVFVEVGRLVQKGDPLFRLDDRELKAELATRQAQVAVMQADLARLEAAPRPEQLPVAEAELREAQARVGETLDRLRRVRNLIESGAVSVEESVQAQQQYELAVAARDRSQAQLNLLKQGTWQYELAVARARLEQAQAEVAQTQINLDRLIVRALVKGRVLQVNVRPGEFVGSQREETLILLGSTAHLHVRTDIDEYDISRFHPHAPAIAMLKGNPEIRFPLEFVRVEPFVIPKRSLTGENTERVDTRVLQVIYRVEGGTDQLYVGQQVDVYIDAREPPQRTNSSPDETQLHEEVQPSHSPTPRVSTSLAPPE